MADALGSIIRASLSRRVSDLTFADNSYYDEQFVKASISTDFVGWYDEAAVSQQIRFILECCPLSKGATVLDVACGHGRHSELLRQAGFTVFATDISGTLISHLRSRYGPGVTFERKGFLDIDYQCRFDLIVVLGNSLSLVPESDLVETLPRLRNALRDDGTLVLELDEREGYLKNNTVARRWNLHQGRWLVLSESYYDDKTRLEKTTDTGLDLDNMEVDQVNSTKRLYAHAEMTQLLQRSGLSIRRSLEDFRGTVLNNESQSMVLFCNAAS